MILSDSLLQKTLEVALSTGADFADVFVEDSYSSLLKYNSQQPDEAVVGQMYGAGIRLFFGQEIIYVTTNDLSEKGLIKAAPKSRPSPTDGEGPSSSPSIKFLSV